MKYIVLGVILLLIGAGVVYGMMNKEEENEPDDMTAAFIHRWLQNDNGTFATYILEGEEVDEDLVQGRETLAETVGLVMYYALGENDRSLFDEVYGQLTEYFLEADGFVNWKLNEDGTSDVSTNALIDDMRILSALVQAYEKWDETDYMKTAVSISGYLNRNNIRRDIYTDFYEKKDEYASPNIKLSYIDIEGMDELVNQELLAEEAVAQTSHVLMVAPLDNGFYPLSYNVEMKEYTFSDAVNLVDQAMLAHHLAQVDVPSTEFLDFIKDEMNKRGLVHGVYDRETKEPAVDYESPAIYGFLILYALEMGEDELAQSIYQRLKEFQVTDEDSEYYGGYSITDGDTHIFDNLVPLLAEQALRSN